MILRLAAALRSRPPATAQTRCFCAFSPAAAVTNAELHLARVSASPFSKTLSEALEFHHTLMKERKEASPALLAAIDAALVGRDSMGHPEMSEFVARACVYLHVYPPGFISVWAASIKRNPAKWRPRQLRQVLPLMGDGACASDPVVRADSLAFITAACLELCARLDLSAVKEEELSVKMRCMLADAGRVAVRAALTLPGGLCDGPPAAAVADLLAALQRFVLQNEPLRENASRALGPWSPANFVALGAAVRAHNQGLLAPPGTVVAPLPDFDLSGVFKFIPGPLHTQPHLTMRRESDPQPTAADYALQRHISALCTDAGLPQPEAEVLLSSGIAVDFAWPERRVVVEVDGPAHAAPVSIHDVPPPVLSPSPAKAPGPGPASSIIAMDDWGAGSTADIEAMAAAYGAEARAPGRGGSGARGRAEGTPLVLPIWRCPGLLHARRWGIERIEQRAGAEAAGTEAGGETLPESPLTRLRNAALIASGWSVVQVVLPTAAGAAGGGAAPALVRTALRALKGQAAPARHWRVTFAADVIARAGASSEAAATGGNGVRAAVLAAMRRSKPRS